MDAPILLTDDELAELAKRSVAIAQKAMAPEYQAMKTPLCAAIFEVLVDQAFAQKEMEDGFIFAPDRIGKRMNDADAVTLQSALESAVAYYDSGTIDEMREKLAPYYDAALKRSLHRHYWCCADCLVAMAINDRMKDVIRDRDLHVSVSAATALLMSYQGYRVGKSITMSLPLRNIIIEFDTAVVSYRKANAIT